MSLVKSNTEKLKRGDKLPQFSLENIDGSIVSSTDFKDKILVIIFICNHCPYVQAKIDEISSIKKDYEDKDVAIVGINPNEGVEGYPEDSFENMKELAEEKDLDYYLVDDDQSVAREYGATCTPDVFVFDKGQQLVFHGRINDALQPDDEVTEDTLREVLDTLLEGEEIEDWFKPSMGCSIKWED